MMLTTKLLGSQAGRVREIRDANIYRRSAKTLVKWWNQLNARQVPKPLAGIDEEQQKIAMNEIIAELGWRRIIGNPN